MAVSALRRASANAVTSRSSRISLSFDLHFCGHAHGNQAAAREALDLDMTEFLLHRLHLRLQLRRLLHHAEKIGHRSVL